MNHNMAENNPPKPWSPVHGSVQAHRDEESAAIQANELLRKKRIEWCLCIAGLTIVKVIIFAFLALVVFRIKSPKIKINAGAIISSTISTTPTPAFTMTLNTQVLMKNNNFGAFKFDSGAMIVTYRGLKVGEAQIPAGKAKMKGTWWMNICTDVKYSDDHQLGNNSSLLGTDLNSGLLVLKANAKLKGKVSLMKIIKRGTYAKMNCNIIIRIANKLILIQDVHCK